MKTTIRSLALTLVFCLSPVTSFADSSLTRAAYAFDPILGVGLEIFNLLFGNDDKESVKLSERKNYKSCNFSIKAIDGWKVIAEPTSSNRVPNAAQTLWYQQDEAYMQVLCVPKSVTLQQWGQATISNLPKSFNPFELLAQQSIEFQKTPSHWIAYKGAPLGYNEIQRGYLMLIDRDDVGLIISIAVPASQYDNYAPAFRAAVNSIELR